MDLSRLSLNQATTQNWGMAETIDGCARAGVGWIGLWRHKVSEIGLAETARRLSGAGIKVSSLCRGGFFPAASAEERQQRIDDNLRAVDEAAELGAPVLVLVCGPAPDRDLDAARQMVEDGIRAVLPCRGARRAAGHRAAAPDVRGRPLGRRDAGAGECDGRADRVAVCRGGGGRVPRVVGPRRLRRDRAGWARTSSAFTSATGSCRRPITSSAEA